MTEKKQKDRVLDAVLTLLREEPQALRYSEIIRSAQQSLPDVPIGTIKNCFYLFTSEGEAQCRMRLHCWF